MSVSRCRRCDQQIVPGEPLPWCLGDRYPCDPTRVYRDDPVPKRDDRDEPEPRIVYVEHPCPTCASHPPVPDRPGPEQAEGTAEDPVDPLTVPIRPDALSQLLDQVKRDGRVPGIGAIKTQFGVGSGKAERLQNDVARVTGLPLPQRSAAR